MAQGAPAEVRWDTGGVPTGTAIRASPRQSASEGTGGRIMGRSSLPHRFSRDRLHRGARRGRPLLRCWSRSARPTRTGTPTSRPLPCALRRPVLAGSRCLASRVRRRRWLISFWRACCWSFGSVASLVGWSCDRHGVRLLGGRPSSCSYAPAPPVPRRTRAVPVDFVGLTCTIPHRTGGSRVRTGRVRRRTARRGWSRSGRRARRSRVAAPTALPPTTRPRVSSGSRPTQPLDPRTGRAGRIGHHLRPPQSS